MGTLEVTDGVDTFWRMEHNFGPAGWQAAGPILPGFIPRSLLDNETWRTILEGIDDHDAVSEARAMAEAADDAPSLF